VILDTNALSAFIDGEPGVGEQLAGRGHASIPVIVLEEFRYGIAGSRHKALYEAWLDEHLSDLDVLAIGADTATVYARVRVALKKAGRRAPAPGPDARRALRRRAWAHSSGVVS
jgi:tRNA(fMet)-specific endonuclease VapC